MLQDLRGILDSIQDKPEANAFRDFAQRIDRIFGAAQTLAAADAEHAGFATMGSLAAACKKIGYGAAPLPPLYATVMAFWEDVLDAMDQLVEHLEDPAKCRTISEGFTSILDKRLNWLTAKLDELSAKP